MSKEWFAVLSGAANSKGSGFRMSLLNHKAALKGRLIRDDISYVFE